MKSICSLIFLVNWSFYALCQQMIDESYSLNGIKSISGDFEWADVIVKNYGGSELKISGEVLINLGENNGAHQLQVDRNGDVLQIHSSIPEVKSLPKYLTIYKGGQEIYIKVKDQGKVDWQEIKRIHGVEAGERCSIGTLIEVKLTLFVPQEPALDFETKYGSMEMIDCPNRMKLVSTYGHLVATLSNRSTNEASLKSMYSFVDLSVPDNTGLELSAHTNHGEIYSNLDWGIDRTHSIDDIYDSKIVGRVNQGGKKVAVVAKHDNVYLRRKSFD